MPKFNMSKQEALALVQYFTAVERLTNPGTDLPDVDPIFAGAGLESNYFTARNKEYFDRLKDNKLDPGSFKARQAELQPILTAYKKKVLAELEKVGEEKKADKASKLARANNAAKEAKDNLDKAEANLKNAKNDKDKLEELAKAKAAYDSAFEDHQAAVRVARFWTDESERLKSMARVDKSATPESVLQHDAYAIDAFKLVPNPNCMNCHQVGTNVAPNATKGPALHLSYKRLRPGWTERWLAKPDRMVYYTLMLNNFPANSNSNKFFAPILKPGGDGKWVVDDRRNSFAQLQAARDILMMYPEASALPANRYWLLPLIPGEKP
jgi:hypothetical protein